MAHKIKVITTIPGNLSLIYETQVVEGENRLSPNPLTSTCEPSMPVFMYVHIQPQTRLKKFLEVIKRINVEVIIVHLSYLTGLDWWLFLGS